MKNRYKAPRILHLPWSKSLDRSDRIITNRNMFDGKEIVVLVKMDGESTSLYSNGSFHARSTNSDNSAECRSWIYGWWQTIVYSDSYKQLLTVWPSLRLVGENMYAQHTIKYSNLRHYFYLHSAWDLQQCLSWQDTVYIAQCLGIEVVSCLYRGMYSEAVVRRFNGLRVFESDDVEGYIVRNVEEYINTTDNIAKFVRPGFTQAIRNKHWSLSHITKNKLKAVNV
jgi:hypothetical protein